MRVLFALCLMTATAAASPAYPFEELLPRAETAFTAELVSNSSPISFHVTKTLRGKAPSPARFDFDPKIQGDLPKGIVRYVVISQGDDHFGKPTGHASLGQEMDGQAGYRGWIVFPVAANGDVVGALAFEKDKMITLKLDRVVKLVASTPYKPKR